MNPIVVTRSMWVELYCENCGGITVGAACTPDGRRALARSHFETWHKS